MKIKLDKKELRKRRRFNMLKYKTKVFDNPKAYNRKKEKVKWREEYE